MWWKFWSIFCLFGCVSGDLGVGGDCFKCGWMRFWLEPALMCWVTVSLVTAFASLPRGCDATSDILMKSSLFFATWLWCHMCSISTYFDRCIKLLMQHFFIVVFKSEFYDDKWYDDIILLDKDLFTMCLKRRALDSFSRSGL